MGYSLTPAAEGLAENAADESLDAPQVDEVPPTYAEDLARGRGRAVALPRNALPAHAQRRTNPLQAGRDRIRMGAPHAVARGALRLPRALCDVPHQRLSARPRGRRVDLRESAPVVVLRRHDQLRHGKSHGESAAREQGLLSSRRAAAGRDDRPGVRMRRSARSCWRSRFRFLAFVHRRRCSGCRCLRSCSSCSPSRRASF